LELVLRSRGLQSAFGLLIAMAVTMQAGCGGGAATVLLPESQPANTGVTPTPRPAQAVVTPSLLQASTMEGEAAVLQLLVTIDRGDEPSVFAVLEETGNLLTALQTRLTQDPFFGPQLAATLNLTGGLQPGRYESSLLLRLCPDAACTRDLPGSPTTLPLRYEVNAQIKIAPVPPLVRVGSSPAGLQVVPVFIPPEVTDAAVSPSDSSADHFASYALRGDRLEVQWKNHRAGSYSIELQVRSRSQPKYRAAITVRHVVEPPPGGEQTMVLSPRSFNLAMRSNERRTIRLQVRRPTWTDALSRPIFEGLYTAAVTQVTPLANDEFEFTLDSSKLPLSVAPGVYQNEYELRILFTSDGNFGGGAYADVRISVDLPAYLEGAPLLSI
jgi:hypothetical protein